jgi:hypothetical protein
VHNAGNRYGTLFGTTVRAARVAFALAYGRWPVGEVQARNGDRLDLRASNLVEGAASFSQQRGAKKPRVNCTSGVPGVTFSKREGKWHAQIRVARKLHHLGTFATLEEAALARHRAEVRFGVSKAQLEARLLAPLTATERHDLLGQPEQLSLPI